MTDYPHVFFEISKQAPAGPWMYTGAMENCPHLVDAIAAHRPLWGNGGSVLQAVRSPVRLATCLHEAGLSGPRVADSNAAHALGVDHWLIKPLASAGGARIAFWDGVAPLSERYYLQEYLEGEPCAAIYVADGGCVAFLGATLQLVGQSVFNAKPFSYCGSIGPLPLSPSLRAAFIQLGNVLAFTFHLRGVFGVDCILRDDVPWPVEVNPRYTASVEVLELAGCFASLSGCSEGVGVRIVGKAILFATDDFVFPEHGPWLETLEQPFEPWKVPDYADIPHPGSRIEQGHPILTVFAMDETIAGCRQRLNAMATSVWRPVSNQLARHAEELPPR